MKRPEIDVLFCEMPGCQRLFPHEKGVRRPWICERCANAEIARLKGELDALRRLDRAKSPCGHWAAHAVTSDGGKHIQCLDCALATARDVIAECDKIIAVHYMDSLNPARAYLDEQTRPQPAQPEQGEG